MQDVALAGQAIPALAAIAEGLNTDECHADRIGVVAMRRKSLAQETSLQAFDAHCARSEPDAARRNAASWASIRARSFKTAFAWLR